MCIEMGPATNNVAEYTALIEGLEVNISEGHTIPTEMGMRLSTTLFPEYLLAYQSYLCANMWHMMA
jgi:hypothetical protein